MDVLPVVARSAVEVIPPAVLIGGVIALALIVVVLAIASSERPFPKVERSRPLEVPPPKVTPIEEQRRKNIRQLDPPG